MTNHSNTEYTGENGLKQKDSVPDISEGVNEEQESSYESRKKSLSKREMMEELSRARFPWDE